MIVVVLWQCVAWVQGDGNCEEGDIYLQVEIADTCSSGVLAHGLPGALLVGNYLVVHEEDELLALPASRLCHANNVGMHMACNDATRQKLGRQLQ